MNFIIYETCCPTRGKVFMVPATYDCGSNKASGEITNAFQDKL